MQAFLKTKSNRLKNEMEKNNIVQQNVPRGWKEKNLLDCFLVPSKLSGVKQSHYEKSGDFPVFDQGQDYISGYSSDKNLLIENVPAILFGDHTRIIKYIKSPFVAGADGTKIFWAKDDFDSSFLYYLVLSQKIPDTGYNRHFKFLKDIKVVLPELKTEQQKIAEILGMVDEDIAKTQKVIEATEKLKRGLMQQLFTRGIGHTKFKETKIGQIPEGWELKKISNLGDVVTGNTPKTSERSNYGEDYLFVSPKDIGSIKYINDSENKLSKKGYDTTRKIPKGSVLVVCIGSTIGKIALAGIELSTNQQINSVVVNDHYSNEFIYYQLLHRRQDIIGRRSTQAVPIINKTDFSETYLALPKTKEEQNKIAEILSAVDEKISVNKKLKDKLTQLKKGLMQDLLSGEKRTI